jgi:hypothetical protein
MSVVYNSIYNPMDKAVKKQWIAALRSGEYQQGKGWLRTVNPQGKGNVFCCLGVLADLHEIPFTADGEYDFGESGKRSGLLPVGYCGLSDAMDILSDMNDGMGRNANNPKDFIEIADWIEENL